MGGRMFIIVECLVYTVDAVHGVRCTRWMVVHGVKCT